MTQQDIEERRLALEERRTAAETDLARARLNIEERQAGRFSGGAVTLIGAAIAVVSSVATTTIGGFFSIENEKQTNAAQLELKEREVDGQIRVQQLAAEAERTRLEIEQKFQIIVQATKGLPTDVASENLRFFVEAGILEDPEGRILRLAEEGRAPDLPSSEARQRLVNPLMERLESLQDATAPAGRTDIPNFDIEEGVLIARGSAPVSHLETPSHSGIIRPRYVVMHFTGSVGDGIVKYLTSEDGRASAHVLVRRDGSIVQLLPFDYGAWHVGRSNWGSLQSLNRHSVGVELENLGRLEASETGWKTRNGRSVPENEVFLDDQDGGWHHFTEAQLATVNALLTALAASNPEIIDVIGHSDVSPARKIDPGPAFPMADLRRAVFGRRDALPPPD